MTPQLLLCGKVKGRRQDHEGQEGSSVFSLVVPCKPEVLFAV